MSAPTQPTDEQLIAKPRAGDQTAFSTLYERHRRSLFRFAMNMTAGNAPAAYGLFLPHTEGSVEADVLLGDDGAIYAVRFIY